MEEKLISEVIVKRRLPYIIAFAVILILEILIGLYVRDRFIRPYGGDILVTVLLCCLARAVFPKFSPALPVFAFSVFVEFTQWIGLAKILGVEGTVIGVIIGTSFAWLDIVCYGVGCIAFAAVEWVVPKLVKSK